MLKIDVDRDGDVDQDDYDDQAPEPANQRPTVSISIPSSVTQPVDGGTRVTPTVTADDPDGSIASYAWSATGGTFANSNVATKNATWIAPAEKATQQTYTLTLRVTDNGGKSNSASVDIRVRAANMLPRVSIQPVTQEVAGGVDVTFEATATDPDPDGSIASYDWNAPPNGGTFADDTIEDATWRTPAEQENAQDYTLTLTVTDDRGGQTTTNTTVTVQAANKKPTVTIDTGAKTVGGNDVVPLTATAEDPDGAIVSYLWTASPNIGTFGNAALEDTTWAAPAKTDSEQRITLTLTATDNEGGTGSAGVVMKVSANNQPTASITTPGQEVAGGTVVTLQATATDDDDTVLTYAWTANPDVGVFSNVAILAPTWTAPAKTNAEQEVTLTLSVSDGTSTSTAEVTITVRADEALEVEIQTDEQTVDGETVVRLAATASDPDGDDAALTYQWTADDGDADTADDGTFSDANALTPTWTAPAKTNADRPIHLTLTVTDSGGLKAVDTVVITVSGNRTPTVSISTGFQLVDGGAEITLAATASDPDQDDTLTIAWTATGGTFDNAATEDPTWTAPDALNTAQAIRLTLTVTDPGGLWSIATVNFTVRANTAPTVTIDTGSQTVDGGDTVNLAATVTDDDTDSLTYHWQADGGDFDNSASENPTWTAPVAQSVPRSYTLTLIVTDNGKPTGLTASDAITITVRDDSPEPAPNTAPTVTIDTQAQTVDGGTAVSLTATASDTDDANDALTFAWTGQGAFADDEAKDTTWTAPERMSGAQPILLRLTVTDSGGLEAVDTVVITVGANHSPTVSISTGFKLVAGGEKITLDATASDPDEDTLEYAWTGSGSFSPSSATIPHPYTNPLTTDWTAPATTNTAQAIRLTLTVTDPDGLSAIATVNFTVRANTAPTVTIDTPAQTTVAGDTPVSLTATVGDEDAESLTYSWRADGGAFVDDDIKDPTWTAPAAENAPQSYTLTLIVTDNGKPTGLTASDAITITVDGSGSDTNTAPTVTIDTQAQTVAGDATVSLTATASDSQDAESALTYAWTAWTGQGTFADDEVKDTTWTAPERTSAAQPILLTLTVTDSGDLKAVDTVVITVTGNRTPTVTIDTGFQLVDGGAEITLEATASDPDGDDLTYEWTGSGSFSPSSATIPHPYTNPLTTDWTAPDALNTAQAIRLTLTVTDPDSLSAIATVNFTVRANRAPGVTIDTDSQTVDGDAPVNLQATVDDQDTGDTHTYRWHADGGDGGDGGTFSDDDAEDPTWTAPAAQSVPRSYTLTLIVTDNGNLTGSDAITITVRDDSGSDTNTAPTVTIDTQAQPVDGGAAVSLTATASDSQDAESALTYAWTGQGDFADAEAKDTTWTAPERTSAAQPILLTLTVTDRGGLKAVDTVVITVRANSLPRVEITSDFQQPVGGNEVVQLTATASDPDGDDLTYLWAADAGEFSDPAVLEPTWTAPDAASTEQSYTLTLTVTDSGGLEVGDVITVIVSVNQAPTVEISTAEQTVDGEAVVTLAATASDPDGDDAALTYQWTADDGDADTADDGTFSDANALTPTWTAPATPDTPLPIHLTLTVTDPHGSEATATVTITVRGPTAPSPRSPDRGDDRDDDDGDGGGGVGTTTTSEYPKLIGENSAAKAWELENNSVLLESHNPDDPDNPGEARFGIGSINRDGTEIVPVGYVRDDSLGQTYAVLRRESNAEIVRRWIAPDSPVALIVPWTEVNSKYTFPVLEIVTIPLDEERPYPNQLVRRFDGGDGRIFSYDADLLQWRHVPDPATFQVLEFYWCDITAADPGFFDRITIGTAHPPTTVPARDDYPSCRP